MSSAPNTGSTYTFPNGNNRTSTSLSTHMILKVGTQAIGAIQSLSISEGRAISMINEVGSDGSIDSTPTSSATISGSVSRIRYDRLRLTEAFSAGYLHLAAQRYPFDIEIQDIQKNDTDSVIITILKNVWFESLSYTFDANNWIITDTANWKAEQILSFRAGGGQRGGVGVASAATGGERLIVPMYQDDIMVAADTGRRRGSLDASGLIDLGLNF